MMGKNVNEKLSSMFGIYRNSFGNRSSSARDAGDAQITEASEQNSRPGSLNTFKKKKKKKEGTGKCGSASPGDQETRMKVEHLGAVIVENS